MKNFTRTTKRFMTHAINYRNNSVINQPAEKDIERVKLVIGGGSSN